MGQGRGRRGCISHIDALEQNIRTQLGDAAYALLIRRLRGAVKAVATVGAVAPELMTRKDGDLFDAFRSLLQRAAAEDDEATPSPAPSPVPLRLLSRDGGTPPPHEGPRQTRTATRDDPRPGTADVLAWRVPGQRGAVLRGVCADRRAHGANATRRGQ